MKTKLTLIALLISIVAVAQNGINYKAVIKDTSGNVVASQSVTVQLTILQEETMVYQETHSTTTDDNGIVILNIGEGTTVLGTFDAIDWGSDNHFFKVEIDTAGGTNYTDMGTTQFMSVPYSKQSTNVTIMPQPYILGRSTQASDAKFAFNGKYGWQAAEEMCMFAYPNDPNVRAFTLEQIAQAIVLGNWDTNNLSNINNVSFWAITPYAVGSNFGSYQSEFQNSFGLNYNSGVVSMGTRGTIVVDNSTLGAGFNPSNTYVSVQTNISNNQQLPCICGTYR